MSEREKLPPGCYPLGKSGRCTLPDGRSGPIEGSWPEWSRLSGITREKWEAMERDHRAMEALRNPLLTGGRREEAISELEHALFSPEEVAPDPADAILAALEGE